MTDPKEVMKVKDSQKGFDVKWCEETWMEKQFLSKKGQNVQQGNKNRGKQFFSFCQKFT